MRRTSSTIPSSFICRGLSSSSLVQGSVILLPYVKLNDQSAFTVPNYNYGSFFSIIQPNGMQLSQKSLNTSPALFELINQIRNCSQKTWKDGSKFQALSWAKNLIQRTVQNGACVLHNTNEGFVYYWYKQVKNLLLLSLKLNAHQPQSGADGYYSCHTNLWMPVFVLFLILNWNWGRTCQLTLHWRNTVILKSSKPQPLCPNLFCSVCFIG